MVLSRAKGDENVKTIRKRQKKTGEYVKFEIRFEPLVKELLVKASEREGVSLTKYIIDAAFNRMITERSNNV